jgi:hypothetical protein
MIVLMLTEQHFGKAVWQKGAMQLGIETYQLGSLRMKASILEADPLNIWMARCLEWP